MERLARVAQWLALDEGGDVRVTVEDERRWARAVQVEKKLKEVAERFPDDGDASASRTRLIAERDAVKDFYTEDDIKKWILDSKEEGGQQLYAGI